MHSGFPLLILGPTENQTKTKKNAPWISLLEIAQNKSFRLVEFFFKIIRYARKNLTKET
jgi:hypothetical protein